MAIRFLRGQSITGTLSVSSTTTLAAATVSAPSTGDDSTRIPSTAWVKDQNYITSASLPTVNNSTITFTAGTGLTGGGTITLNQSSNETVTFNNSITNNNQLTNGAGYTTNTGTTTASNTQTFTNKSGNISQWTNDSGYITSGSLPTVNNATITLTAGTGLTGGGTITLNQSSNETVTFNNSITNNNQLTNGEGYTTNTGTVTSVGISHGGNAFSVGSAVTTSGTLAITMAGNNAQYVRGDGNLATFPSIPQGDITAVVAGSGISGGGTSGSVTITNSDKGSSQNIFKNIAVSGQSTVVADNNNDTLTLVASGGMTITTNASTDTITFNPNDDNDNYYVTSGSYSNGTLTLNRQGLSAVSVTGFPTDNDELSNGAGYITSASLPTVNNSTITFSAGTGLTGGGTITLNQSSNETVTFNASNNGTVTSVNFKTDGTALNVASNSITTSGTMTGVWQGSSSEYVNGEGDLVSFPSIPQGDITAVVAGTGMSGGGTSGSVTLNCTITNNNQLSNGAGYITASSSDTLTNKGGNISQWTNDSGYLTSAGSMSSWILKEGNGTETSTVTNGETVTFAQGAGIQTELTSTSSGGTLTISNTITNNNQLTNGEGYTTNTGTTTASNTQTFTNKSGNISQWTNNSGYITSASLPTVNNATITLTAGTGLTGGGTITLNQSSNETVTFNATNNGTVTSSSGADNRVAVFTSATNIEGDSGFLYSGGQITASSIGVDDVFLTATAASSAGSAFCVIEATQIVTRTAAQVRSDIGAASSSSINNPTITFTAGTGLTGGGAITLNQSSNETVTFNNSITNNNQLTNGAGYTTNTGTVTGSGSSGRVAYWNSSSGITSDADLTFNGSSLTVGGIITSTQGNFQSNGEVVMSNSSSSSVLLLGDVEETDGISQIGFKAAGSTQMEVDDGSINASSNVDLLMQGGDIRLTGDTNINLDATLSTNQSSGIVLPFGSGTVTGGKFYYWAGLTWSQTDADSENSSKGLIAYAKTSGSASANRMLLQGIIYKASHGFVLGIPLYLSTNQGDLQATAPSGTNDVARVVGYSLDANHIYFNPDNTWVKIA